MGCRRAAKWQFMEGLCIRMRGSSLDHSKLQFRQISALSYYSKHFSRPSNSILCYLRKRVQITVAEMWKIDT